MKQAGLWLLIAIFSLLSTLVQADDPAKILVKQITLDITSGLRAKKDAVKADPGVAIALVDKIVLPHFDFTAMSRKALRKIWKKMSAEQKVSFEKEFKMLLVRTYSKALADNYDQEIKYLKTKKKKSGKLVMVQTEVQQSTGFPIPLNYKLKLQKDKSWKVIDVVIDGISLISNYKNSFAKEVRDSGVDKLIARLQKSNKR